MADNQSHTGSSKGNANTAATPPNRDQLQKSVKQQIMLSIGLNFKEKDELIRTLSSLTPGQLKQLSQVFEEEDKRKEQMLYDFFSKHPDLYPEFERFSKEHVSSIYNGVEQDERVQEESRMQEILATGF